LLNPSGIETACRWFHRVGTGTCLKDLLNPSGIETVRANPQI